MTEEIEQKIPAEVLYSIYYDIIERADKLFIVFASIALANNYSFDAIIKDYERLLETIYNRMEELLEKELGE